MIKNFYKKKNQQTCYFYFYHYFFLLFGFFGGNLWGSFFSSFYLPPFFFVIGILLCLEILSYIYYKNIAFRSRGLLFNAPASSLGTPFMENPKASKKAESESARPYPQNRANSRYGVPLEKFFGRLELTKGKAKSYALPLATVFTYFQFNKRKGFSTKIKVTNEKQNDNSSFFFQKRNKSLYLVKVGLVFGLFVDAFKVGS